MAWPALIRSPLAQSRSCPHTGARSGADIVPAILEPGRDAAPPFLPAEVLEAPSVVLLILDGLGAEQLAARRHIAPTLHEMQVATITTVAPSTTASALTSIATGVEVGEHGVVGYRIRTCDGNLNVLRWRTPLGDAVDRHVPEQFQPIVSLRRPAPARAAA